MTSFFCRTFCTLPILCSICIGDPISRFPQTSECQTPSTPANTAAADTSVDTWRPLQRSEFILAPQLRPKLSALTNVVPQVGWNNEGIWNTLERIECDDYPKRYGVTESVCGPVLGSQRIGRIPVPRALYKIIERPDGKCLAFLIPQDGSEIPPSDLDQELTSVAQVEQATGLVFDFVPESQKQTVVGRRW